MQTTIDLSSRNVPCQSNSTSLAEAKKWIGHRMILRRAWLGFASGTRCRVMCVVDFGDGVLLWLVTDDEQSLDVDQLEISFVAELFCEVTEQHSDRNLLPDELTITQSIN